MSASFRKIIPFEFSGRFCDVGLVKRWLGKLLFPYLPSDLRRRKINILLAVLLVSLLLGGIFVWAAIVGNKVNFR